MNKSEIGNTGSPTTMHIERGKIREFARAIKDDNPIYFNEEYAKQTVGGIIPPPTFAMTQGFWDEGPRKPLRFYLDSGVIDYTGDDDGFVSLYPSR